MKTVAELIGEAWGEASADWELEPEELADMKAIFYSAFSAGWRGALDYLHEAGQVELVSVLRDLKAEMGVVEGNKTVQ